MSNTNSETEKKERKDRENKVLKQFWLHPALAERIEGAASFTGKTQVDVVSEILAKALKVKIQPDLEDFAEKFGPPQEFTNNVSTPAPKLEPAPEVKPEKRPVGRPAKVKPPKELTWDQKKFCVDNSNPSSWMLQIWRAMNKGMTRERINNYSLDERGPDYARHLPEEFETIETEDEAILKIFDYTEEKGLWDVDGTAILAEMRKEVK